MRVVIALSLLAGLLYVFSARATETSGVVYLCQGAELAVIADPADCDGTAYEIEGRMWVIPSPTDEPQPTATNTPAPTATNTPAPTATSTPVAPTATNTPAPQGCTVPAGADVWHAPTDHEHGDKPPAWADDWSCAQFGHPVIFGGDEQTPNENLNKHNAYKGFSFTKEGVQLYVRLHFQSNPHGRSAVWHSYEVFARDQAGNVSHWQGWVPVGEEVIGGGHVAGNRHAQNGGQHFIAGASTAGQVEQWYIGQKYDAASWSWDFVWNINDPTTLYNAGEEQHMHDMDAWEKTGAKGLQRTLVHALYYIDGDATSRYPWRNNPGIRGWFCATPQGTITSQGSKDCDAGSLPQHVATTMPALESVQSVSRSYSCAGCQLPN